VTTTGTFGRIVGRAEEKSPALIHFGRRGAMPSKRGPRGPWPSSGGPLGPRWCPARGKPLRCHVPHPVPPADAPRNLPPSPAERGAIRVGWLSPGFKNLGFPLVTGPVTGVCPAGSTNRRQRHSWPGPVAPAPEPLPEVLAPGVLPPSPNGPAPPLDSGNQPFQRAPRPQAPPAEAAAKSFQVPPRAPQDRRAPAKPNPDPVPCPPPPRTAFSRRFWPGEPSPRPNGPRDYPGPRSSVWPLRGQARFEDPARNEMVLPPAP